jgi:hypothetical protein
MGFIHKILFMILFTSSSLLFSEKAYLPEKEEGWVLLIKEEGLEKFLIRFPDDPKLERMKEGNCLRVTAKDAEVEYSIVVEDRKGEKSSEEILWEHVKHVVESKSVEVLHQEMSKSEKGDFLDIVYRDGKLFGDQVARVCKTRVVVTKDHIYRIFTVAKEGQVEKHEYFVGSFVIDEIKKAF